MPRFLSRLPYGAKTNPVEEFDFEEETTGADSSRYTWSNAAFAMARNINRAFSLYGWCTLIRGVESGGAVEELPAHTFPTDDGGVDMKCPTEIAITDRREAELAKNGLMPLVHRKNSDQAVFIGARSLQEPAEYFDVDAARNASLAARLPWVFAVSRFAQYLILMAGLPRCFKEASWYERYLNDWLQQYVLADSDGASDAELAARPLRHASLTISELSGQPGTLIGRLEIDLNYPLGPARMTGYLRLRIH